MNMEVIESKSGKLESLTSTDNKLNVNAFDLPFGSSAVSGHEGFSDEQNKINFVVPNGKEVGVTSWTLTNVEGKMQLEWQVDGVTFDGAGLNHTALTFASRSTPAVTPLIVATAGQTIRARREAGDQGKEWFASFSGFQRDV